MPANAPLPASPDPRASTAATVDDHALADPPGRLEVTPWPDPVIDAVGYDPRSSYVERFWLPVLGPSSIWLLRHLAAELEREPDGLLLDVADAARSLGVGARGGRNSPFTRSVERIVTFGFARRSGPDAVQVRQKVPPLTQRQLSRLPLSLQRDHELWVARDIDEPPGQAYRRRARALASSLLALGEDVEAVERQLHRWRFHPAVAHEAVRWAREQSGADPSSAG